MDTSVLGDGLFARRGAEAGCEGTGIGRATIKPLISLGMSVTASGFREEPLAETAEAVNGQLIQPDVGTHMGKGHVMIEVT